MAVAHKLTDKEARFVHAFLGDAAGNAAKAAEIAGYAKSSAKVTACRLLKKEHIKLALVSERANQVSQVLQSDQILKERVMTGDEALERLTLFARGDIGQILGPDDPLSKLPADVRATIKAVRYNQYGRNIELYDAMKATELMAKAGGKLIEKHEITGKISLEDVLEASRTAAA